MDKQEQREIVQKTQLLDKNIDKIRDKFDISFNQLLDRCTNEDIKDYIQWHKSEFGYAPHIHI